MTRILARHRCHSGRRLARTLAAAAALQAAAAAIAGAQVLRGRVSNADSQRPLSAVSVSLYSDSLKLLGDARSDSMGDFTLRVPRPGSYYIMPRRIGFFGSMVGPLAMATRDTFELVVHITPVAMSIGGVTVTASRLPTVDFTRGFEGRRARGIGSFVTREEIERIGAGRTLDLLRGVAGVSVIDDDGNPGMNELMVVSNRGTRSMAGACRLAMFVDGLQVDDTEINRSYRPSDFEAIEVYAAAQVPIQFSQRSSECGAILFWSKYEARREKKKDAP